MGNLCDCFDYPFEDDGKETRDVMAYADRWICNLPKLKHAQLMTETKKGLKIKMETSSVSPNKAALEQLKRSGALPPEVRLVMDPPFTDMDRILDNLFLTGIGGMNVENFDLHNISVCINATHELPHFPNFLSMRIPVDDDPEEDISIYFHDVADFIHRASCENFRTVVHCFAGASRSTTIVLAYLVKHIHISLKEAFVYVQSGRPCARPNMSFFQQLIRFEKEVLGRNSVQMHDYPVEGGGIVRVPDFYRQLYPHLFDVEVRNQLRKHKELKTNRMQMAETHQSILIQLNKLSSVIQ